VDPHAPSFSVEFEPAAPKPSHTPLPAAPELSPAAEPVLPTVPSPAAVGSETAFAMMSEALAAVSTGRLSDAVVHYGDVLDLEPDSRSARIGRGRALMNLGQYAAAMSDFQRAEDADPDAPEPMVAMGDLFFARKDYERAIHRYDAALERQPEHAMALCRRGICHHYRASRDLALDDLTQAQRIDPGIPSIERYVAMARSAQPRR
jgi:tetratricopeptide (TPR) repeat protein